MMDISKHRPEGSKQAATHAKQVSLVVDILGMWSFIESACSKFSEAEKSRLRSEVGPWASDAKFWGFDGRTEGEYMSIALFLVNELGLFQAVKGRSLNTHTPNAARFAAMLRKFEQMSFSLDVGLTVEQVIELLIVRV
jgi:uncharacterized protein